jgi:hypothetical protein
MLKSLTREIRLAIQARSGASAAVMVSLGVVALALLTAFVFVCVAGYVLLALRCGGVTAGLIMAGFFAAIAIVAAVISALIRRRVRERAILARAAKAHAPSWLLDPRVLNTAVQVGRSMGWQRIVPIALVGIMVAQWAREHRGENKPDS